MWQKFDQKPKDKEHILVDYNNGFRGAIALKIWNYDFFINDTKGIPEAKWCSVENLINSR